MRKGVNKQLHLDLCEFCEITDVIVLGNVYKFNLYFFENITDVVSGLKNVHLIKNF